jgi:putative ABC transport system permease protein
MRLLKHLRSLFRRRELDVDLDEELKFHVELKMLDYIAAGMDPEEARTAALRSFGGVAKTQEECRDMRGTNWFANFGQDLRYAGRTLAKDRRFSLLAILALALGIGSATVIFSAIYGVILNTFPFKDANEVTSFGIHDLSRPNSGEREFLSFKEFLYFREHNHVFDDLSGEFGGFGSTPLTYTTGSATYQFDADFLSANSFQFFGVNALLGRLPTPDDVKPGASPVFVIGDKLWRRQFNADPKIVGQSFMLNGIQRTLVGIMPPRFRWAWVDVWVPFSLDPGEAINNPDLKNQYLYTVGRLKSGVTLKAAVADLDVVAHQYAQIDPEEYPKQFTVSAESLADRVVGGFKELIYPLLAAVAMLLLIACSNVANLLLTRASAREKEIAVRSSLGASRGRLMRQFLVESCVLGAVGCVAGCLLAWIGIKAIVPLVPYNAFPQEAVIQLNPVVLAFSLGIAMCTTLFCGLAPAIHAVRGEIQPRLMGGGKGTDANFRHGKLRAALVIAEVALSIILLCGAGLMMRTFWGIEHVDFGFNSRDLLSMQLVFPQGVHRTPQEQKLLFEKVFGAVENLPGVAAATVTMSSPPFGGPTSEVTIPGKTHSERWTSMFDLCSAGYFQTLQVNMLNGRLFSDGDVDSARRIVVINQTFARNYFGNDNPIGQNIKFNLLDEQVPELKDALFEIIGVVSDIKNRGLQRAPLPEAYLPYTIISSGGGNILVRTAVAPESLVSTIRQAVWAVDSNLAVTHVETIEATLQREVFAFPRFEFIILGAFGIIGLTLVIIGVFSVMAYTVSLQTHEIGIRMALGAQHADILRMVLRKGLSLVAGGILIGLAASFALTRLIASQLWGVSANDPWTFSAVVAVVVAVGAAACFLPARRATRVDPLVALRHE